MGLSDVLKVFYAPHKVFKDIVQKPSYIAPLILLIIFIVAQLGSAYVVVSRTFIEQTKPAIDQGDVWTENSTLWMASPGVAISENHNDFINASAYYNDTSIEFKSSNSSSIQMALTTLEGNVNCGPDGFKTLSFRVKIVAPDSSPNNVTMFLYSLNDVNYFTYDLTSELSNSTATVWNNITIPVGSGNWQISGAPNWANITNLGMAFMWDSESNIDLRVDGLFFGGIFTGILEVYGSSYLTQQLIQQALAGSTSFLFQWLIITALMYLIIKGLKGNVVWKPLMVAVGFAMITLVVQAFASIIVYSATLPDLYYPLEVVASIVGNEFTMAYQTILNAITQATTIVFTIQFLIIPLWTIALGTFIIREVTAYAPPSVKEGTPVAQQLGWSKSFAVALASVVIRILLQLFVGI